MGILFFLKEYKGSSFSASFPNTWDFLLIVAILMDVRWHLIVWVWIPVIVNGNEDLFVFLLVFYVASMSIQRLTQYFKIR